MHKKISYSLIIAIFLCVLQTACAPFGRFQGNMLGIRQVESSVPVSDPNRAIMEQLNNLIMLGDPILFTDDDTGKSHEVRIQGSKIFSSLEEAEVDWEFVVDSLVTSGKTDSTGVVLGDWNLMLIDVDVVKLANGVPSESITNCDQHLRWFSLSGPNLINEKGEFIDFDLIGYVQPDASKLHEYQYLYFSNFPNVGDTYVCKLVLLVDDSIEPSAMRLVYTNGKEAIVAVIAEQGGS